MNLVLLAHLRDDAIGVLATTYETPDVPRFERPFAEVGDYGANVEQVQRMLTEKNEELSAIDGIFGLETWLALTRFQKDHSLRLDGVASDETLRLLELNDRPHD